MKKTIINLFVTLVLMFCLQTSAFAVLNLELTKGIDSAVPIAVVPFQAQGNQKPTVDITKVITNDLQNSGQFKTLDEQKMQQQPTSLKAVDFGYWRGLGIDNLVIGNIQSQGKNTYQVNFSLIDVYKARNKSPSSWGNFILNVNSSPVVVSKTFIIKDANVRRLAHKISDIVYQKLTGVPGIFSTKIAYVLVQRSKNKPAKYSLMIADADGYNAKPILVSSQPIMSPAWSPEGKSIAYVSFEGRRVSLYISDIATGKRRLVTQFPGINGAPAWSPDGKRMAVVLSREDNTKIFLIDLHARVLKQLTHGWGIDTEPSFAPDGKSIIFTSDRGGSPQIYSMDLSNNKVTRITFTGNYNAKASFTPDGKNIVMLHRDQSDFSIAIQNLKTGEVNVLTKAGDNQSPSIAPNGKEIIYATNNEDQGVLALVSVDGKVQLTLPETDGAVREPVWGPFED